MLCYDFLASYLVFCMHCSYRDFSFVELPLLHKHLHLRSYSSFSRTVSNPRILPHLRFAIYSSKRGGRKLSTILPYKLRHPTRLPWSVESVPRIIPKTCVGITWKKQKKEKADPAEHGQLSATNGPSDCPDSPRCAARTPTPSSPRVTNHTQWQTSR